MSKYRILLAGKNQATIDDFFYVMDEEFECMCTSVRSTDIANHITYFKPDAFVYCFASGVQDDIAKLATALNPVVRKNVKLILIGDIDECNEFERFRSSMVSLVLLKPITATAIKTRMIEFFEQQHQMEEDERLKQELIEKELAEKSKEPKHILVIDDDPIMLRLIKQELKAYYNVATAVNGKIGLNFLERKKTDLILLDYEMPEESGADVLVKLRANDKTKDIPVIFLTGINDREKIKKVLSMKPQGYLLKPIECEQLVQAIGQVIG